MKKMTGLLLCLALLLGLSGCGGSCGGNVKDVEIKAVPSEIYSAKDIDAAIQTIVREFDAGWSGCALTEICYAGDAISSEHQDTADRYDADEVIVLLSSFDVDASGGDGSLNPNSTYSDWMWLLVRNAGGAWRHVDHGY